MNTDPVSAFTQYAAEYDRWFDEHPDICDGQNSRIAL
jgi:hypothetical protein